MVTPRNKIELLNLRTRLPAYAQQKKFYRSGTMEHKETSMDQTFPPRQNSFCRKPLISKALIKNEDLVQTKKQAQGDKNGYECHEERPGNIPPEIPAPSQSSDGMNEYYNMNIRNPQAVRKDGQVFSNLENLENGTQENPCRPNANEVNADEMQVDKESAFASKVSNKTGGNGGNCTDHPIVEDATRIHERKSQIDETIAHINNKVQRVLLKHDKKINDIKQKLAQLQNPIYICGDVSEDLQNSQDSILALKDKLAEADHQIVEFTKRCEVLKERCKEMNSSDVFTNDLNRIMLDVGKECKRLTDGLPIYGRRQDIIDKIRDNQVSIILGETGSGKSTQLVQYLYDEGFARSGLIVCTQPRKVAATSLAERVASEMVGICGNLVGYKMGAKRRMTERTKILFSTDHSLLNECLEDPLLTKYSCIIVDEAHERSIHTDILLSMIKCCLRQRQELKVVITSATIDPEIFISYFDCDKEMRVSGRTFPVELIYEEGDPKELKNYEAKAVDKVAWIHKHESPGDILVFLTCAAEITTCCEAMEERLASAGRRNFRCFPLHGQLASDEQKKAFEPLQEGVRKIVFATNCAETSVTIDGIKYVVDTGVAKEKIFDPEKNMSDLSVRVISKSSADQRKGRAGRTASGKCFRLYTEAAYQEMPAITLPEILRVHLGQAVLKLAELGVDAQAHDFVQSPSQEALQSAVTTLKDIEALSDEGITDLGRWVSKLPFSPRQGALVFHGNEHGLLFDTVVLASLINNGADLFHRGLSEKQQQKIAKKKNQFSSDMGDLFTSFEIYKHWCALSNRQQVQWCREHGINSKGLLRTKTCIDDASSYLRRELNIQMQEFFSKDPHALVTLRKLIFNNNGPSLCHHLGRPKSGYYSFDAQVQVFRHPSSSLIQHNYCPEWVIYTDLIKTSRNFIKGVTPVEEEWVKEALVKGKLKLDFYDAKWTQLRNVYYEEVGKVVFKALTGPSFSFLRQLETELTDAGVSMPVVEANVEMGSLAVYAMSPMDEGVAQKIDKIKLQAISELDAEESQFDLGSNEPCGRLGIRVTYGPGGRIKTVLFPGESNTILIKKASKSVTEEEIRNKFCRFGLIKECVSFKKSDAWGLIKYDTAAQARLAVEGTADHECSVAVLKDGQTKGRIEYELKLSWCRRPKVANAMAFIQLNSSYEVGSLVGRYLILDGAACMIKRNRKKDDGVICFNTGEATEEEIKAQVMDLLAEEDPSRVHVAFSRERVPVMTEAERKSTERRLGSKLSIRSGVTKDKFQVNVLTPTENAVYELAFVKFDNPASGYKACKHLGNGDLKMKENPVKLEHGIRTSLPVTAAIFHATEARFEKLKRLEPNVDIKWKEINRKSYVVDLKSKALTNILKARKKIQTILDGLVFDCGKTPSEMNLLNKDLLLRLLHGTGCVFDVDNYRKTVHLYGSENNVRKAHRNLDTYLKEKCHIDQEVHMRDTYPPGLMKALMAKYGNLLDGLVEETDLVHVNIDWKKQKLYLKGTESSIAKAMQSVSNVSRTLQPLGGPKQEERSLCVLCARGLSCVKMKHRLQGCGHDYCHDCLRRLVKYEVTNRKVPLVCAKDTCEKSIVLRDLRHFFSQQWICESTLVKLSVDSFVSQNRSRYKFCITPNCPIFYEVDKRCIDFCCPACFASMCKCCHKASPCHSSLFRSEFHPLELDLGQSVETAAAYGTRSLATRQNVKIHTARRDVSLQQNGTDSGCMIRPLSSNEPKQALAPTRTSLERSDSQVMNIPNSLGSASITKRDTSCFSATSGLSSTANSSRPNLKISTLTSYKSTGENSTANDMGLRSRSPVSTYGYRMTPRIPRAETYMDQRATLFEPETTETSRSKIWPSSSQKPQHTQTGLPSPSSIKAKVSSIEMQPETRNTDVKQTFAPQPENKTKTKKKSKCTIS